MPRLTPKIRRGLEALADLARSSMQSGLWDPAEGWPDNGKREAAEAAIEYLNKVSPRG